MENFAGKQHIIDMTYLAAMGAQRNLSRGGPKPRGRTKMTNFSACVHVSFAKKFVTFSVFQTKFKGAGEKFVHFSGKQHMTSSFSNSRWGELGCTPTPGAFACCHTVGRWSRYSFSKALLDCVITLTVDMHYIC